MIERSKKNINELILQTDKVTEAMRRGVRNALRTHKKLGQSIAIWKDGQVVIVPLEEIEVEEETAG